MKISEISKTTWLLIGITIIAAFLRIYNLGRESLWLDEAATKMFVESGFWGMWEHFTTWEPNPPLNVWLTIPFYALYKSEFTLRLIPALAGIATVPAVYYLGKVWRNSTIGLAAAALIAFSPLHIYYSQEARAYSLVTFLSVLMLWSFLTARKTNEYKWWILTAIFSALALWTHYYVLILIGVIYAYALYEAGIPGKEFRVKEKLKRVLPSIVIFIWLTLPITLVGYYLATKRFSAGAVFGLTGFNVVINLLWNFGNYTNWIAVIFVALFCIGIYSIHKQDSSKSFFLLFLVTVSCGASILLSYKIPIVSRYLLFLLPIYIVVLAEPITMLKDRRLQALAVCGLIALSAPSFSIYYSGTYIKDDWRGFGSYLSDTTNAGDTVILAPSYLELPLSNYYNSSVDGVTIVPVQSVSELTSNITQGSTWVVLTPDVNAVPTARDIPQWLQKNAKPINRWVYNIDLYHI